MKYYIIAGEASGDLHGSNLIKALKNEDPDAHVRCWGGDLMAQAGGTLAKHYKSMAFMGFIEVLKNLPQIFKNLSFCKEDIRAFSPDVIIFIDFSGFNLRIAKWAHAEGYRTNYYIAPQVWASREGRVAKIKRDIDQLYVILPFEKAFYEEKHQMPVNYVGHPLLDAIAQQPRVTLENFCAAHDLDSKLPIIALLPGSRKQEVRKILTTMLAMVPRFDDFQFVIAGAPSLPKEFYTPFLKHQRVHLVMNTTYPLLQNAHSALVTSGTATLETALFKVPQVVCYKGSWISYQIAKRIITLDYISLVNLIMGEEVVTELIQNDLRPTKLEKAFREILESHGREKLLSNYDKLIDKLGGQGASTRVAKSIYSSLQGS